MKAFSRPILIFAVAAVFFCAASAPSHAQSNNKQTVVVAGGSGRTGSYIMKILSEEGYQVRGLTRNVARARQKVSGDFEWFEVDVRDIDTLSVAFEGAEYVISAITGGVPSGPNSAEFVDYGGVKNLADVAVQSGVDRFVLISSVKATVDDPENLMNKQRSNLLIWKFRGEEHLRQSGLDYTIVRPGGLVSNYEPGTRGLIFDQGDKIYGEIHRADVAAVCVSALLHPAASRKTFEVISNPGSTIDGWRADGFDELVTD